MLNLIRWIGRRWVTIRWTVQLRLALGCGLLSATLVFAQGVPLVEVGADYNYVHANAPPDVCGCLSMHGGNAWFAYSLTHSFAVVAEISSQRASDVGSLGDDLTLTSYLFGPRYSWRRAGRFTPFAQFLVGGAHASGSLAQSGSGSSGSSNAFALIAGGGLDIAVTRHIAIRAVEADFYRTQFANGTNDRQNNLRISAGIIFRFGEK